MEYYVTHSVYSDPKEFERYFLDFPMDIPFICHCIHHLFLHYADLDLFNVNVQKEKYNELNNRYLYKILKTLFSYDKNTLTIPRTPEKRVMGICRDSSLLLCAILRFLKIPARLRSGYVNYFIPGLFLDGLVVEFYDFNLKRWRLVDTRTSQKQIEHYQLKIDFDLTDLPREKFISAALAWKMCREGSADPLRFGSRQFRGLSIVRNRLIQDLALLNKEELLVWDVWGGMLAPLENNIFLIDNLSKLLLMEENNLPKIKNYYENNPLLMVSDCVYVDSPFSEECWFDLSQGKYAFT